MIPEVEETKIKIVEPKIIDVSEQQDNARIDEKSAIREVWIVNEFVWVENPEIDSKGEWLKVKKVKGNQVLCERKDPFHPDVYIDKSDIIKNTFDQIF